MGATTRNPCSDCKFLGTQALALSKTMFHVDSQGILTLDSQSKNRTLIRVNGIGAFGKKQLWDGDVLTIGRYSSVSWMTLDVKTKRVVTPEVKKLPTKNLIKRCRDTGDAFRVGKDSVGTKRVCTTDCRPPYEVRHSSVWLKTSPGQRRHLPQARPLSSVDLFDSLESVDVLSVTPEKRRACKGKHVVVGLDASKDTRTLSKSSRRPRKKLRNSIDYKYCKSTVGTLSPERCLTPPATSSQVDNVDDDVSSEPRVIGLLRLERLREGAGSEGVQLNVLAVEHANSTSSKKALETQAARHNDTPPRSIAEEAVLSLPQCPTYDGESSDLEGSPFVDGQQSVDEILEGEGSDPISEVCR